MSKQGERRDDGMKDAGKVEEVRQRRGIPEAALWGSLLSASFPSFRLLFQSQLDSEPGDSPAQSVPKNRASPGKAVCMRSPRFNWDSQQPCLKEIKMINTTREGQARKMGAMPTLANTKVLLLIPQYSIMVAKNRPSGHLK